jgi:hypothetical protein
MKEEAELVCGCSPHRPCGTAAPLFKYGRKQALLVHLTLAFMRTSNRNARKNIAPPGVTIEASDVAASETNTVTRPTNDNDTVTNRTR